MFNTPFTDDDLVRCPCCGNLYPDWMMEPVSHGHYICPECLEEAEEDEDE